MIKIFRSLPETQSLREYVENEYGLNFDNFSLYRDIGGAVYFTNAASKKLVFKLSIAPYSEKAIKATQVINFLKQNDFSVVSIIPAKNGESYVNVEMPEGNRIGTLFEFIEGNTANHNDIYEIGKFTGKLHSLLSQYKNELPNDYKKENFVDILPEMLRQISYDNEKIKEIEAYGEVLWNKVKNEPLGVIHGDLDLGNIMNSGIGYKIIDCDNVTLAPLAYDIAAVCTRMNFMKVNESDIEMTKATIEHFNKGYGEERGITFDISKILNFIAIKRFEAQGQALYRLVPVEGNHRVHSFVNATYQWFVDWKRIFG